MKEIGFFFLLSRYADEIWNTKPNHIHGNMKGNIELSDQLFINISEYFWNECIYSVLLFNLWCRRKAQNSPMCYQQHQQRP